MTSAAGRPVRRLTGWVRRNPVQSLAFIVLTAITFGMMWMAVALALRTGLFGFSAGSPPTSQDLPTFATFIGGGLATAATMFGALLTAEHNARERKRLDFETITKSLEAIPPGKQRVAGVLATALLLGQPRIAIRMLEPAWKADEVDNATATWIIDEILGNGTADRPAHSDGESSDRATIKEASIILLQHAKSLTNHASRGDYEFAGHFMDGWEAGRGVPPEAKYFVLQAMADVLLSESPDWWSDGRGLPSFPLDAWLDCARRPDEDSRVKNSAAALFSALYSRFSSGDQDRYEQTHPGARGIVENDLTAFDGKAEHECLVLARKIKTTW
ncbi:hypothetical protein [Amycolatopsis benzoatilytica]|uniref:hypothetical protein n=1 Tax=Amycolatopsis benzoatilytica TaxID=346045 RepID=UPI00037D49C3|nr:hypothetical protein [Amycolatopsis benzoatilytica]